MPRIVDHAQRRTEIVHALWAVIHARGIDAVSLRAIAEAGGISIGRVQHYFTSRDELVREGCRQLVRTAQVRHADRTRGAEPAAELRILLHGSVPTSEALRLGSAVWYAYLTKAVSDPALAVIVTEAVAAAHSEATRLVVALVGGDERHPDPSAEALRLLALRDGLAQRVLVGAVGVDDALSVIDREIARLHPAR